MVVLQISVNFALFHADCWLFSSVGWVFLAMECCLESGFFQWVEVFGLCGARQRGNSSSDWMIWVAEGLVCGRIPPVGG